MTTKNYTKSSSKWTKESIIAAIQSSAVDGYCKSTDVGMSVTTMAKRLFGSFELALNASGAKLWSSKPKPVKCACDGCDNPVRSGRAVYCETHYYRLRRNGTLTTINDTAHYDQCAYCGSPSDGKKFCDANCRNRKHYDLPVLKQCQVCGGEFKPFNKNVCCSEKCASDLVRRQSRECYARAMQNPDRRKKVRDAEYKRKALKVNAFVEHVDLHIVFKRDKGICWLCNKSVDINLKWPAAGFATLDHVAPLARGGMHSYGNIKLAHLSCNCKKGAKQIVDACSNGIPIPVIGQAALF